LHQLIEARLADQDVLPLRLCLHRAAQVFHGLHSLAFVDLGSHGIRFATAQFLTEATQ
jgi:hypothetical protein